MAAAIGDGGTFERGRDFGAWLGLVPRQYSTGGRSILRRISKRGDRYLRTMFIQAAKVLLMRPQSWERFSFGPWLCKLHEEGPRIWIQGGTPSSLRFLAAVRGALA